MRVGEGIEGSEGSTTTLLEYFLAQFGPSNSEAFLKAQENFIHSCAAYSLACYFLQVKDRLAPALPVLF